jgi:hypothetical protein
MVLLGELLLFARKNMRSMNNDSCTSNIILYVPTTKPSKKRKKNVFLNQRFVIARA